MKLVENLCYYTWQGKGNNCHSYLFANVLRGDRPHIIIDPGHIANELGERCWEELVKSMSKDGFRPEEVGLIINTHSHLDHCEANQLLLEKSREKGGKGKAKQALLAFHKEEDQYRKKAGLLVAEMLGRKAEFEPDFYLQEGELILGKEGKLNLKVLHTPGHSPGSICLYWSAARVLISGDVIFNGGVGRTDLPGGKGSLLKQSIEKVALLDIEYLLPGHSTEFGAILSGKDKVVQNFAFIRINYFPFLI